MSWNGFEVDRERLDAAAKEFEDEALALESLFRRVAATIETVGPCWGEDELGTSFAEGPEGYLRYQDETMDAFALLATAVQGVREALGQTVANYEHGENAAG